MTTKPTAPKPAPKQAPKQAQAPSGNVHVTNMTDQEKFWLYMLKIQEGVAALDFGSPVGRGGSELKDSHALHHHVREQFIKDGVTYDLVPISVNMEVVPTGFAVFGEYLAKFFMNGKLVYETTTFGAFDTSNSAQATHGAYTAARTSLLFNITQASVKSQEDIEAKRDRELNKQAARTPATPTGGGYY